MGRSRDASISIVFTYSAPSSEKSPSQSASASARSIPRCCTRYSTVLASGATRPVKAPTSAAMLVMVARSSTESDSTAGPAYSMICPIACPSLMYGWRRISSMKSLAVTFSGFSPVTTTRNDSGTSTRTSLVIHELKIAVVPTPKATHPTAPACGVWLSEPMMTWPGSAYASRILLWQIASEPCLPCPSSPYSRTPCFSANSRCFTSSWFATSSRPELHPLGRHGVLEEGQVVAEEEDRLRLQHPLVLAHQLLEEDGGHRRHVLVAEADVRLHEPRVARLHPIHADLAARQVLDPVPREDLLGDGHGARPAAVRVPLGRRQLVRLHVGRRGGHELRRRVVHARVRPGAGEVPLAAPAHGAHVVRVRGCGRVAGHAVVARDGGVFTFPCRRATL
jgi:hypothetical protein